MDLVWCCFCCWGDVVLSCESFMFGDEKKKKKGGEKKSENWNILCKVPITKRTLWKLHEFTYWTSFLSLVYCLDKESFLVVWYFVGRFQLKTRTITMNSLDWVRPGLFFFQTLHRERLGRKGREREKKRRRKREHKKCSKDGSSSKTEKKNFSFLEKQKRRERATGIGKKWEGERCASLPHKQGSHNSNNQANAPLRVQEKGAEVSEQWPVSEV